MHRLKLVVCSLGALVLLALMPATAHAQSAIGGTVKDTSGAVQAYHNEAMIQEAVYLTAGGTAETLVGGLTMNLVPKDGGNRFAGAFKYAKPPASWQGDN